MEILSVPVIIALVSAFKMAGLPSRLAPLASIMLGVLTSYLFVGQDLPSVGIGLIFGLSASGLYSGAKATMGSR